MTLIELLAVIVIITTIVAAAIPLISPSNDDRRMREAARGLNTFLTGAQARAITLRRPVGVALKRLGAETKRAEDNSVALEAYYVEQPAPYAGFDANSRAAVAIHPDPNWRGYVLIRFGVPIASNPPRWSADYFPTGMVRPGDVIEINGSRFQLLWIPNEPLHNIQLDQLTQTFFETSNANQSPQILARPLNDTGQQIIPMYDDVAFEITLDRQRQAQSPYWSSPAPYRIIRQPTAMADEPYQLPDGIAIDLRASGVGDNNFFYVDNMIDNSEGVLIMFAPEGRVSRLAFYRTPYNSLPFDQPVNDNIYLLVGRRDRTPPEVTSDPTLQTPIPTEADALKKLREPINWLNGDSRWVVIGSQSGRIATIENGAADLAAVLAAPPKPYQAAAPSTEEMRCAQIMAAREHTQTVGQLGGR